jgi:hypothetical protein
VSILRALPLATLALVGCRDEPRAAPTGEAGAPSGASSSVARTASSSAPPACRHRRPFDEAAPLSLAAPFDAFTPCAVLAAVFADYDADSGSSVAAGGKVGIDRAQRWDTAGRALLAFVYYTGADAEGSSAAGGARVAARVAVVERQGEALTLVARGQDPWRPKVEALFNGRAEIDPAPLPFEAGETLLALRTPWSTGMPGTWTSLALYRLHGGTLSIVFEDGVAWNASGMGTEDDDLVAAKVSTAPRVGGPDDLRLETTETRCHLDLDKPEPPLLCGKPVPLGAERWRFDGKAYRRIEGKKAPLPKVLHKLWGW